MITQTGFVLFSDLRVLGCCDGTFVAHEVQHRLSRVGDHERPEAVGRLFGPPNLTSVLVGSAPRAAQTNGVVSGYCAACSPGYWVSGMTGEETFQLFNERCRWVGCLERMRAGKSLLDSQLPVRHDYHARVDSPGCVLT